MRLFFRSLVVTEIFLIVILWTMPFYDHLWLSAEMLDLVRWSGYAAIAPVSDLLYWGSFFLWLLILTGLFLFIRVTRLAFFLYLLVYAMLQILWGVQVSTPIEMFLSSVLGVIDGVLLSMAYFSSVSSEFKSQEIKENDSDGQR